jgi:predicted hydrocarbon binding protein
MHGLIFVELKKYVESKYNHETWELLLEKAGLKHQMYLASAVYPDGDALSLVTLACQATGLSSAAVLEDFGSFMVPDLIEQYKFLVKPEWGLLEFLENTEETIHKIMRFHKGVTPPRLAVHRVAENKSIIRYSSARKLCPLLKGMVKGSAKYYREEVTVMETSCMMQGDPECTVTVQVESVKRRTDAGEIQKAAAPSN